MTILCGTDFSPASERAVRLAGALALVFGDRITLVNVVDLPAAMPPETQASSFATSLREDVERSLEEQAAGLRARGIAVDTAAEIGPPADTLVRMAAQGRTRLVVVGAHGRRGAARVLLGSVAERVVRTASTPVLVVPPTVDERHVLKEAPPRPLRIVAAVDFSPAGAGVVAWLASLRQEIPCEVTFLHMFWPPREYERLGLEASPDRREENEEEVIELLGRELTRRVGDLPGKGRVDFRVRATWGTDPAPIAWEAEVLGADLLVVGTRQKRGVGGSTAIGTLRASAVPVVCVPERAAPARLSPAAYSSPRRLLVPTDLSATGNAAVGEAYRLLRAGGGIVELLHVTDIALSPEERGALETRLRLLAPPEAEAASILTRATVEEAPTPVEAILHTARRRDVDLIVMGSHGRSGLSRALLGSVAESVVRASERPVMVVRAEAS
jgi:nucleotide-binding universal stress UspA family protein